MKIILDPNGMEIRIVNFWSEKGQYLGFRPVYTHVDTRDDTFASFYLRRKIIVHGMTRV